MLKPKKPLLAFITLSLLLGAVGTAFGHEQSDEDAALATRAKIHIADAVTTAEHQTNGQAIRAVLANENGTLIYDVEVVKDGTTTDVAVDAQSGKPLSIKPDTRDQNESPSGEEKSEDEDNHREANAARKTAAASGA